MIHMKNLDLSRIEVVKKKYDKEGRVVEEQFEFYYPKDEKNSSIGFKT